MISATGMSVNWFGSNIDRSRSSISVEACDPKRSWYNIWIMAICIVPLHHVHHCPLQPSSPPYRPVLSITTTTTITTIAPPKNERERERISFYMEQAFKTFLWIYKFYQCSLSRKMLTKPHSILVMGMCADISMCFINYLEFYVFPPSMCVQFFSTS